MCIIRIILYYVLIQVVLFPGIIQGVRGHVPSHMPTGMCDRCAAVQVRVPRGGVLSTHKHQETLMSAETQVNRSLSSSVSSSARQKCIFRVSNAQNFRACAVRAMTVLSGYTETANTSAAYCIECIVLCSTEGWPAAVLCIIRIILY